jgi:Rab9 effector protein with kelch motifs
MAANEDPALRWSAPLVEGTPPAARGGHTVSLVNDDTLVFFGGQYYKGDDEFTYLNDVWCLDLGAMTWYQPKLAKGPKPEGRYGHTGTLVGTNTLYIFGGRASGNKHLRDVWCLDMSGDVFTWTRVNSATAPPTGRMGHSDVLVGDKIVYFGGTNGKSCFSDLWVFDTATMTWLRPRTAGRPPTKRYNHTMSLLADGRILVMGGYMAGKGVTKPEYYDDVRELDTETMVWSRPRVTGSYPKARNQHATCMMGRQMVMFGGWTGPPDRSWDDKKTEEEGTGGSNVAKTSDQLLCLDTDTMEWFQPTFSGDEPSLLYGHTLTRVGASLFAIGGWDGSRPLNEVRILEFPPPDEQIETTMMETSTGY